MYTRSFILLLVLGISPQLRATSDCLGDTLSLIQKNGLTQALRDFGRISRKEISDPLIEELVNHELAKSVDTFQKSLNDPSLTKEKLIKLAHRLGIEATGTEFTKVIPEPRIDSQNPGDIFETADFHLRQGNHPSVYDELFIDAKFLKFNHVKDLKTLENAGTPSLGFGPGGQITYMTKGAWPARAEITELALEDNGLIDKVGSQGVKPRFVGNGKMALFTSSGEVKLYSLEHGATQQPKTVQLEDDFNSLNSYGKFSWGPKGTIAASHSEHPDYPGLPSRVSFAHLDLVESKVAKAETLTLGSNPLGTPIWNDRGQVFVLDKRDHRLMLIDADPATRKVKRVASANTGKETINVDPFTGPDGLVGVIDNKGVLRVYSHEKGKEELTQVFWHFVEPEAVTASFSPHGQIAIQVEKKLYLYTRGPGNQFERLPEINLLDSLSKGIPPSHLSVNQIKWGPHGLLFCILEEQRAVQAGQLPTDRFIDHLIAFQLPTKKGEAAKEVKFSDPRISNASDIVFGPNGVVVTAEKLKPELHFFKITESK